MLPTDRNSFSTVDGSSGWRTIQEASASDLFYQHGWLWETISEPSSSSQDKNTSNWTIDKTLTNIDIDGWAYSTDFSSYTDRDSGVAMKGMMHFVRRRRLIRKQFFNGRVYSYLYHHYSFHFDNLVSIFSVAYNLIRTMEPLTCDYCDLSEVERLSSLLLDRFVRASMVHHPRTFTIAKANKLKNDFVEALGLTSEGIVQYSYENTMSILDRFADAGKSSRSISSLTMSTTSVEDLYDKRLVDVARSGVLEKGECNDLAKICLQRFDPEFRFHCENVNCSQQTVNSKKGESESNESEVVLCPFRYEICPNEHCGAEYSAKWTQDHDSICPLKTVDCERVCGRAVLRKLMSHHMQDECMLRPVRCQYLKLGCEASK